MGRPSPNPAMAFLCRHFLGINPPLSKRAPAPPKSDSEAREIKEIATVAGIAIYADDIAKAAVPEQAPMGPSAL
eukprot:5016018-Pyramimonas_sp.AAC.1